MFVNYTKNNSIKWVLLFISYFLSFGLNVFNDGVFWDDWTVYDIPLEGIIKEFNYSGYYPFSFILKLLYPITVDVILYSRIFVFLIYYIMAIILFAILKYIPYYKDERFLIVTLFLLLPFNHARISFVILNHVLNLFFFLVAFLCFIYFKKKKSVFLRITSIILFFISFFTNSLFFYYVIFLLYIFDSEIKTFQFNSLFEVVKKQLDYFIIPVIFLSLKFTLLKPSGFYAGYNQVKLNMLLMSPFNTIKDLLLTTKQFLAIYWSTILSNPIYLICLFIITFIFISFIKINTTSKPSFKYITIAFLIIFLGFFPYSILGKTPYFTDWNSRHQLLLPIGYAIMTMMMVKILFSSIKLPMLIFKIIFSIIIACSISYNFQGSIDFHNDNMKQISLIENLRNDTIVQNHSTFFIVDNFKTVDAKSRNYRFYEYGGILKKAFGNDNRFASNDTLDFNSVNLYSQYSFLNSAHYIKTPLQFTIYITPGLNKLQNKDILTLLYSKYMNHKQFSGCIKKYSHLRVERYNLLIK